MSKKLIKEINVDGKYYDISDTTVDTLVGEHEVAPLGDAAWKNVDTEVTEDSDNLITSGAVYNYAPSNSDWNAEEGEPGYIENRPFYQERDIQSIVFLDNTKVYTDSPYLFNGGTGGGIEINIEDSATQDYLDAIFDDEVLPDVLNIKVDDVRYSLPFVENSSWGAPYKEPLMENDFSNYPVCVTAYWYNPTLYISIISCFIPRSVSDLSFNEDEIFVEDVPIEISPLQYYYDYNAGYDIVQYIRNTYGQTWDSWPESLYIILNGKDRYQITKNQEYIWGPYKNDELLLEINITASSTTGFFITPEYEDISFFSIEDNGTIIKENIPLMAAWGVEKYNNQYQVYNYDIAEYSHREISIVPSELGFNTYNDWPDSITVILNNGDEYNLPKSSIKKIESWEYPVIEIPIIAYGEYQDFNDFNQVYPSFVNYPVSIIFADDNIDDMNEGEWNVYIGTSLSKYIENIEIYADINVGEVHKIDPKYLPENTDIKVIKLMPQSTPVEYDTSFTPPSDFDLEEVMRLIENGTSVLFSTTIGSSIGVIAPKGGSGSTLTIQFTFIQTIWNPYSGSHGAYELSSTGYEYISEVNTFSPMMIVS